MEEVKTNIRIPGELYEAIKRLAAEDLRSINAEVVILLREAVAARDAKKEPPRTTSGAQSNGGA